MDTVGGLVDKLITVDTKMWYAQEEFYKIRYMSFQEFMDKYYHEDGMAVLWKQFVTSIDLNLQRNTLIDEVDQTLYEMIRAILSGEDVQGKFIQEKHKTYG